MNVAVVLASGKGTRVGADIPKQFIKVAGKPVYTATLVKYADLLCDRPCGQGMLSGITEA